MMIRSQLTNFTVDRFWLRYFKCMSNTSYCFSVHARSYSINAKFIATLVVCRTWAESLWTRTRTRVLWSWTRTRTLRTRTRTRNLRTRTRTWWTRLHHQLANSTHYTRVPYHHHRHHHHHAVAPIKSGFVSSSTMRSNDTGHWTEDREADCRTAFCVHGPSVSLSRAPANVCAGLCLYCRPSFNKKLSCGKQTVRLPHNIETRSYAKAIKCW